MNKTVNETTEVQLDVTAQWIFFVSLHLNDQSHAINEFNERRAEGICQWVNDFGWTAQQDHDIDFVYKYWQYNSEYWMNIHKHIK